MCVLKKGWKSTTTCGVGRSTWFFRQNIFQCERANFPSLTGALAPVLVLRIFPLNFKIFENHLQLGVCVHMCGLQLKRAPNEYIYAKHTARRSLEKSFFVYTFDTWKTENFPFASFACTWEQQTRTIQFVTEINSESNHQYSMFASNVRSHNRKLTTLLRAARFFHRDENFFFRGFPFGRKFATADEKLCVWWKERFFRVSDVKSDLWTW